MAEPTAREKEDLEELLQELRVALPGVQVLLAVLLTVPFSGGFEALGTQERVIFLGAVLGAATATVLLIAPSAHHRFAWPTSHDGIAQLVRVGTIEARLGMLALAWTITAACYVVVWLMFPSVAVVVALLVGSLALLLWVALPMLSTARRARS